MKNSFETDSHSAESIDDFDRIRAAIEHAAHFLPAQGPITVFIHHNTLHAFEEVPFSEAVKKAAQVFGSAPYLSEDQYRDALLRGRIRFAHLQQVLEQDLGDRGAEPIPCFGTRLELQMTMLEDPLQTGTPDELLWHVAEADALNKIRSDVSLSVRAKLISETRRWVMRDLRRGVDLDERNMSRPRRTADRPHSLDELLDRFEERIETWTDDDWEGFTLQAMWRICCDGVRNLPPYSSPLPPSIRHRDLLLELTGVDSDILANGLMIRFVGAFLDQGLAASEMPLRKKGFLAAFCEIYGQPYGSPESWQTELRHELRALRKRRVSPLDSVRESLQHLGVPPSEWESYIAATLLALRGWGGMVHQIEMRGDRAVIAVPAGTLVEFLAVRLLIDRFAVKHTARSELNMKHPLAELRNWIRAQLPAQSGSLMEQRAFQVFKLAQIVGLTPDQLHRLSPDDWETIVREIESFGGIERCRIFHEAYERRFREQTLDAVSIHAPGRRGRPTAPSFQIVCCLDEREESFRRHLEEIDSRIETFGAAGFFSTAMYYRGAADAHFTPLCPVVIRPQHWVVEEVADEVVEKHHWRARVRQWLGVMIHTLHRGSRTIGAGTLLTGLVGMFAMFPLVLRIFLPRVAAEIRRKLTDLFAPPSSTRLTLERSESNSAPKSGNFGFTVPEMADISYRLLSDLGFTNGFARLVVILGHGSDSLNNPYVSAYNCGACGGSAGGPNARAAAQMLNDARVREILAQRGLLIPDETVFVGGYHNTCRDRVNFSDRDSIPESHSADFAEARAKLDAACSRNAHERCRRFMSAQLTMSVEEARRHVEARSEDLAQTRPELGHATNAIVAVGRREWTRGLFLDRRAFLTSYDPTQDDADSTILTRILEAVFPVCSGINLEYYFSRVDNSGYGSGTKLPHNLTSLLGVMDGAASDLRTGLPLQMVEIHEPVRALFIIETTPTAMMGIIEKRPAIGRLCRNGWVQLAVLDPDTRQVSVYEGGTFNPYVLQSTTLPHAASSMDWYRGWRDHLEFSQIEEKSEAEYGAAV